MLTALALAAAIAPTISSSVNDFGIRLLKQARRGSPDVVISPFSGNVAFAAIWSGLQGNTGSELARVLSYKPGSASETAPSYLDLLTSSTAKRGQGKFLSATSLWVNGKAIDPDFQAQLQQFFLSSVSPLGKTDQETVDMVNSWCVEHTDGMIQKVLSTPLGAVDMILANAAVFQGRWAYGVSEKPMSFHQSERDASQVTGLYAEATVPHVESGDVSAVLMPYDGSRYVFLIALPKTCGLSEFVQKLDSTALSQLLASMSRERGKIFFPAFKRQSHLDLLPMLAQLGAPNLTKTSDDFWPIFGKPGRLTRATQDAVIEVDREGTKAAAVTVIQGRAGGPPKAPPPPTFEFTADRPFLYAIVDTQTGCALFLGTCESVSS